MPLLQYCEPGGEIFLPFARNKLKLMHEEMARLNRASARKVIYASDSSVIFLDALYLGNGQFRDSIRITAAGGPRGRYAASGYMIQASGQKVKQQYPLGASNHKGVLDLDYKTVVDAVSAQTTFTTTRSGISSDPSDSTKAFDFTAQGGVGFMSLAGSFGNAGSFTTAAITPDGTKIAAPTAVVDWGSSDPMDTLLRTVAWDETSQTWSSADAGGPMSLVTDAMSDAAAGTAVLLPKVVNTTGFQGSNSAWGAEIVYPLPLLLGDTAGKYTGVASSTGIAYIRSAVNTFLGWDVYTGDVLAMCVFWFPTDVSVSASYPATLGQGGQMRDVTGTQISLGLKYDPATGAWTEVHRVTIPTFFQLPEYIPEPGISYLPSFGSPLGGPRPTTYLGSLVYNMPRTVSTFSGVPSVPTVGSPSDLVRLLVSTPTGPQLLTSPSAVVTSATTSSFNFGDAGAGARIVSYINFANGVTSAPADLVVTANNATLATLAGYGAASANLSVVGMGANSTYALRTNTSGADHNIHWRYTSGAGDADAIVPATANNRPLLSYDGQHLWLYDFVTHATQYWYRGTKLYDSASPPAAVKGAIVPAASNLVQAISVDKSGRIFGEIELWDDDTTSTVYFGAFDPLTTPPDGRFKVAVQMTNSFDGSFPDGSGSVSVTALAVVYDEFYPHVPAA